MRIFKTCSIIVACLLPASLPAFAQQGHMGGHMAGHLQGQITVTGEGVIEGMPDMAILSLGVTTQGDTAAEAMAANTAALATVLERLKASGIDERDLQTSNLSLNPNWSNYDSSSGQKITGYTASNLLSVRVRALPALGGVIDAAIADGANALNGLTFALSEPRPALDAARKAAVVDARAKAELLAAAAGVGLGPILSITESGGAPVPGPMFRAEAMMSDAVPVEAGTLSTKAVVTIVYQITQ